MPIILLREIDRHELILYFFKIKMTASNLLCARGTAGLCNIAAYLSATIACFQTFCTLHD